MNLLDVAVLDDYQGVALEMADWSAISERTRITTFREHIAHEDDLVAALSTFGCLVVMRERTPLTRSILQQLPALKLIVTTGPVNASIDLDAAQDLGIQVLGTVGGDGQTSTIELAWALILGLARNMAVDDADIRAGRWQRHVGVMLAGRTLGLVGLGNLGARMIPIARAFGMSVSAWSKNLDARRAQRMGVMAPSREEFFSMADVVSVHLKQSPRSVGYVSRDDLNHMGPSSYLINTSRGPVVDEVALVDALVAGRIAGAGLDVFSTEPLPMGHRLLTLPNVLLSPHKGFVTRETYGPYFRQVVEDIGSYLDGRPRRSLVLPP
jgi:phosphoglycerate dehydrogenase-like enzyme